MRMMYKLHIYPHKILIFSVSCDLCPLSKLFSRDIDGISYEKARQEGVTQYY